MNPPTPLHLVLPGRDPLSRFGKALELADDEQLHRGVGVALHRLGLLPAVRKA